jgi:hypothetical protein
MSLVRKEGPSDLGICMHFAAVYNYTLNAFLTVKAQGGLQYQKSITPWPTLYNLSDSADPPQSRLSE